MIKKIYYQSERFSIELATEPNELMELGQLRFEVFAKEQNRPLPSEWLQNESILEETDKEGINIIAKNANGQVVGGVRLNTFDKDSTWGLLKKYQMDKEEYLGDASQNVIVSRLVVKYEYRSTRIVYEIFKAFHKYCLDNEIDYIYTLASASSIKIGQTAGFRHLNKKAIIIEGLVVEQLLLETRNKSYLHEINSLLVSNFN